MIRITDAERRRRLAVRHRLAPAWRGDSVGDIADSLVAIHSSDPVTPFLAIAARSNSLTVGDVEHALYDARTVLRHHAMRRTLWVTTPRVAEFVHAACTRKLAAVERSRSAKFVGDEPWFDRAVARIAECVRGASHPLGTREIGELLPDLRREIVYGAGTRNEATGYAHTRAVLVAALDGLLIRGRPAGSWIGSQYAWADAAAWRDIDWRRHSELDGASATVRMWLERFGPGTLDDIVWWTGTTKTLARRALDTLDVVGVDLGVGDGLTLVNDVTETDPVEPWVALLPGLDPTAMGWKQRGWYLDDETQRRVRDRNGNIGPTIWADGRIVGGWAQRPDGTIAFELTQQISADQRELLDGEIDRLVAFIGAARFRVRFPAPNQRELLG